MVKEKESSLILRLEEPGYDDVEPFLKQETLERHPCNVVFQINENPVFVITAVFTQYYG